MKREKKLRFEDKNKKKALFTYFYLFFLAFKLAFPFKMCYIHIIKQSKNKWRLNK
ncbi:hypothetical protein EUBHAL_00863 [Anaerobutyricum hallii DSM 3353]|uniref:Uncharacterized protein n=1 Tax=Anaerobutyricum hallii DSM 3353 TaxID=411469 RepID=C0ETY0_9FIRM|nr:hypothetical protein EUBHAL_00863 [Anaerobutyricum hallii DSM 3353]